MTGDVTADVAASNISVRLLCMTEALRNRCFLRCLGAVTYTCVITATGAAASRMNEVADDIAAGVGTTHALIYKRWKVELFLNNMKTEVGGDRAVILFSGKTCRANRWTKETIINIYLQHFY